jgi:hypothetical protein
MDITEITTATRTALPNGKWQYEQNGKVTVSKVLYTHTAWHALTNEDGSVPTNTRYIYTEHKSLGAAMKASYKYGVRVAVVEIKEA